MVVTNVEGGGVTKKFQSKSAVPSLRAGHCSQTWVPGIKCICLLGETAAMPRSLLRKALGELVSGFQSHRPETPNLFLSGKAECAGPGRKGSSVRPAGSTQQEPPSQILSLQVRQLRGPRCCVSPAMSVLPPLSSLRGAVPQKPLRLILWICSFSVEREQLVSFLSLSNLNEDGCSGVPGTGLPRGEGT